MEKIGIFIFSFITLVLICMTTHAAVTPKTSTLEQLPSGAFWIDNHWRMVRGCAEFAPVHWRNTTGCLRVIDDEDVPINDKGLDHLFISGSANPTLANMTWLKKNYGDKHPVYIIDLRQETHLFINGLPISIFYKKDEINWGKTLPEIIKAENDWVRYLSSQKQIQINKLGRPISGLKVPTNPIKISIKEVYTEAEVARKAGLGYFRFAVPDYHPPTPEQVDQFLSLVKKLPANSWLHFHCAAGNGRTTTFMVMRDILANGKNIALTDIVTRQALVGGIDLFAASKSLSTQPWKSPYHEARIEFIKLFYTYIHTGSDQEQSFTHWIKKQPEGPYKSILTTSAYPK